MKKGMFIIVVLSSLFSSLIAAAPSQTKIKNAIKKSMIAFSDHHLKGLGMDRSVRDGGSFCENIVIKKIKILKKTKMTTGRYKYLYATGPDVNKVFVRKTFHVRFKVEGSCRLKFPTLVDNLDDIRKGNNAYKRVFVGRVPFRKNLVYEVLMIKDTFDIPKWVASDLAIVTKDSKKRRKSYRERLYRLKGKNKLCKILPRAVSHSIQNISCLYVSDEMKRAYENSKMNDAAEDGLRMIKYERHLYTPKVKELLLSQPKKIREYVFGTYYQLAIRRKRRESKLFIRKVVKELRNMHR